MICWSTRTASEELPYLNITRPFVKRRATLASGLGQHYLYDNSERKNYDRIKKQSRQCRKDGPRGLGHEHKESLVITDLPRGHDNDALYFAEDEMGTIPGENSQKQA